MFCKSTVYLIQEFILHESFRALTWNEIEYHCYKKEQKKIVKQNKCSSKRNSHIYSAITCQVLFKDYLNCFSKKSLMGPKIAE